jgi:hypothetical protein
MPVALMELPGDKYWGSWDRFIREQLLARKFISPEDLSFYKIVTSPEEAGDYITDYYSTYNSLRIVRSRLVIRLEKELKESHITKLNEKFRDLIQIGKIAKTTALPDEADEPGLFAKPRLTFAYNRSSAGRLNEMIMEINRLGQEI